MTNETDRKVAIPTIHINGTSAESLLDDLMPAYDLCGQLQKAMRQVTPNARDYYILGEDATREARDQHAARQERLSELRQDLEEIIIGIQDQQDRRRLTVP